jgi:hypothetical protein
MTLMTKRWRSVADYDLANIDVGAVIRREILIKKGVAASRFGAVTQGEIISSLSPHDYFWIVLGSCIPTDSSIQIQPVELQPMLPFDPSGVVLAHAKVVAQIRHTVASKSPLIEEPVAEEGFVYPKQKVVNIRKGRRLTRKP